MRKKLKSYFASKNDEQRRLLHFAQALLKSMPNSLLQKAFRNGRIKVNGKKAATDYRLVKGDLIELYINDEYFTENSKKPILVHNKPAQMLQFVYDDENISLLYKPTGLLCHSDETCDNSLIDSYIAYLLQNKLYSQDEISFKPALCNRLDRGTEGIVIAAKNYIALRDINEEIKHHNIEKYYLAVTDKAIEKGIYKAFSKRDEAKRKTYISSTAKDSYSEIKTNITDCKPAGQYFIVEINLITGKTHQIRAHLDFLGVSIVGDKKYGKESINSSESIYNQLLTAYKITFKHTLLNESLQYLAGKSFSLPEHNITRFLKK